MPPLRGGGSVASEAGAGAGVGAGKGDGSPVAWMQWASDDERLLFEWAWERGMDRSSPVRPTICPQSGCRGLVAARHIDQGEIVLRVPHELLMSTDTALRDPEVMKMVCGTEKEGLAMKGKLVLTVHLLMERAKSQASAWHRFIRSLPENYDTYENWTEEELSQLQFPDLIRGAHARRGVVAKQYSIASMAYAIIGKDAPSYQDFVWAWGSVSTRSCSFQDSDERYKGEGADAAGCLVPVLDLLNHSPNGAVAKCGLSEGAGYYEVKVGRSYEAGDEVLIHYGGWSNEELLEYYGFATEQNPFDSCALTVPIPSAVAAPHGGKRQKGAEGEAVECGDVGSVTEEVLHVLLSLGKQVQGGLEVKVYRDEIPWSLMTLMRWNALGQGCEPQRRVNRLLEAEEGSPVSARNEVNGLRLLVALVKSTLDDLPTSAEEDEEQARGEGSWRERMCIGARGDRKRLLASVRKEATKRLATLEQELDM